MNRVDKEKVIKEFCEDVVAVKNLNGFSKNITISESLYFDVVALLKEQQRIIEQYQKADGFLFAHGWDWAKVVNNDE